MADRSIHTAGWRRRRRARRLAAAWVLTATGFIASAGMSSTGSSAATPAAPPTCLNCATPHASPTPSCNAFEQPPFRCPSPSPSDIVISPGPSDPPTPNTTPAYLIGLSPSPTDTSQDTGGIVAPLGGGTTNNGPPGGGGGTGSGTSATLNSSGPPLPLLILGLVLASAIAAFVLWRYAPRGKALPATEKPPPLTFTPYGSEAGPTNLLDPTPGRPPRD